MPYHKMLQKIISDTNFNNNEIVKKLNEEYNIKLTNDHFSKVLNGHKKPFKEETSRAIAKICNADKRLLILEGYFDNAPKEIKDVFYKLYEEIYLFLDLFIDEMENIGIAEKNELIKKAEEMQKNETMAQAMIEILDIDNNINNIYELLVNINSSDNLEIDFSNIKGIPVTDNAMKPLLTTEDKVMYSIQDRYNNGEIVLINYKGKLFIRQIYEFGSQYVLTCINKEYEQKTINKQEITILGRVTKKISKL